MDSQLAISRSAPDHFFARDPIHESRRRAMLFRRLAFASLLALFLHLLFIFAIAPLLRLTTAIRSSTEVVRISSEELARMKERILGNKTLPPLLKQELHERFRSKEKPKDAQFIAPFNQVVPEETVAGAQPDAPADGGGARARAETAAPPKDLRLSNLWLGSALPRRREAETTRQPAPAEGPPGPRRPVGREDRRLKKSGQNLLSAVESEYYSFFARFEEPVIRNWYFLIRSNESHIRAEMRERRLGNGSELPLTVEFAIDRRGNFRSVDVVQSSGLPTLDRVTREAVRKLGALPNPPPGLFEGGQYFTYRLQFVVQITDAPIFQSAPGLTWY